MSLLELISEVDYKLSELAAQVDILANWFTQSPLNQLQQKNKLFLSVLVRKDFQKHAKFVILLPNGSFTMNTRLGEDQNLPEEQESTLGCSII